MIRRVISILVLAIILVPMNVSAQVNYEYTRDYQYEAAGESDEETNRLDSTHTNNMDSWDPVPSGVWYGGYPKESRFRSSLVPDTNCSIILAQVVKVPGSIGMSGSSYFVVRLPVHTGDWESAFLEIFMISNETRWVMEHNSTASDHAVSLHNEFRINFTSGAYNLTFFAPIYPNDTSPTNGNDYFTRSNRTFVQVNAPLYPNVYYLMVLTVKYPSDSYIEFYWQPDTLSGDWNRSTYGYFNRIAPDDYELYYEDFNISLGFSFDFREGMCRNSGATNLYAYGTGSTYTFYRKVDNFNLGNYPTIMFPFETNLDNVSIQLEVYALVFNSATDYELIIDDTSEWNDFLLYSDTSTWSTLITEAWEPDWDGWLKIRVRFLNDTRVRLFFRDYLPEDGSFNESWLNVSWYEPRTWVHSPGWRYDPENWFMYRTSGETRHYHFRLQCVVQSNDYYWQMNTPPVAPDEPVDRDYWDLTPEEQAIYSLGKLIIQMADVLEVWNLNGDIQSLRDAGIRLQLIAESGDLPSLSGIIKDALNAAWDALKGLGQWIWKVGQKIVGAVSWFVNALVYYGSVILGMLILVIAFFILFIFAYFSLRFSMAIRKALLGDVQGAADEITKAGATASTIARGAGRLVGRGK